MFRTKLQETFILTDCIFYDPTTSDQSSNYFINTSGGASLSYQNGYYILSLGTSSNYVDLRSIASSVKGKTVNFEVDVVLNGASVRTRVYNGGIVLKSSPYTTTDGTIRVEDVTIPNDENTVFFRLERRYTDDGNSISFKNFKVYLV